MEKILVTTDFSQNSLSGLRFAIQLATQRPLELIFFHVNDLWDDTVTRTPAQIDMWRQERFQVHHELESLVETTYKSMGVIPGKYQCVLYYNMGVINSILHYALHNDCHYICISTHGSGRVAKLLGSNTGALLSESMVPVLSVPQNYTPQPVNRILYACDMADCDMELSQVIDFAKPLDATIQILNIVGRGKVTVDMTEVEGRLKDKHGYPVSVIVEERDSKAALADHLDKAILEYSPSMLIMFTKQDRNLLELLFNPSLTERYSFRTTIPLLAFPKGI